MRDSENCSHNCRECGSDCEERKEAQSLPEQPNAGTCVKKVIDIIVTKSVSRFARNTVDSLTTVRKLKEKGLEVCFEKKDFYMGKVPKNAIKWASFETFGV